MQTSSVCAIAAVAVLSLCCRAPISHAESVIAATSAGGHNLSHLTSQATDISANGIYRHSGRYHRHRYHHLTYPYGGYRPYPPSCYRPGYDWPRFELPYWRCW